MIFKCGKKKKGTKKYFMLVLLLALVFVASSVYADAGPNRFSNNQNVKTYVVANSLGSGAVSTSIATTTITPLYHRILGYTIQEYAPDAAAERVVALYDCASTAIADAKLIDETETSDNVSATRWYPYPKQIDTQLTVRVGANMLLVVYYEDRREI